MRIRISFHEAKRLLAGMPGAVEKLHTQPETYVKLGEKVLWGAAHTLPAISYKNCQWFVSFINLRRSRIFLTETLNLTHKQLASRECY